MPAATVSTVAPREPAACHSRVGEQHRLWRGMGTHRLIEFIMGGLLVPSAVAGLGSFRPGRR